VSTIGSLFSGIGGLELGLEWAGLGRVTWQVEKDAYCRQVLAKHWPDAVRYEDVRAVGAHNLSRVDVLCGGFPCQDISIAGKGAGLSGARSGLWSEYARIIRELRPRIVVVENVSALVVRGLDRVLCDLAASGYDAVWFHLRASDVGAPHLRERLFIVAYADGVRESQSQGASKKSGDGLATAAKHWATPTVNGASTNSSAPPSQRKRRCKGTAVEAGASRELPLNPAWVECLMGFPEGWTAAGPQRKAKPSTRGNRRASRKARADESSG